MELNYESDLSETSEQNQTPPAFMQEIEDMIDDESSHSPLK